MLLSLSALRVLVAEQQALGKTCVFTNGCFDILHIGHVRYLTQARQLGDMLIVGLNSDASVTRLKGPSRPFNPAHDRAGILSALEAVSFVCVFEEDTPYNLIAALQPDILVKGGDYQPDTIVGADIVRNRGGKVIVLPFVEGRSTTSLAEKIRLQ